MILQAHDFFTAEYEYRCNTPAARYITHDDVTTPADEYSFTPGAVAMSAWRGRQPDEKLAEIRRKNREHMARVRAEKRGAV